MPAASRVTVPLPGARLPVAGRLRSLVANLVQLRPVLEDPARELWLELPDRPAELVVFSPPEPDPERPVLFDDEVKVGAEVRARIVVRRAERPIAHTPQRALRRGGLLVRSGRAAHEVTLGSVENLPGARHLYGEVLCEAIEEVQRAALESPRPQLVVKADRTGLNEHHPLVQRLYAAIDEVLRPSWPPRSAGPARTWCTPHGAIRARDEVGLASSTTRSAPRSTPPARPDSPAADADDRAPATNGGAPEEHPPEADQPSAPGRGAAAERPRSRRCASSSCWSGCIRASSAASRCSSTPRASPPAHRSRCSQTPACGSSCGRRSSPSRTREAGRG